MKSAFLAMLLHLFLTLSDRVDLACSFSPPPTAHGKKIRSPAQLRAGKSDDYMQVVSTNKAALRNYEVVSKVEAGLSLLSSEVKAARANNVDLKSAYLKAKGRECFLHGCHFGKYDKGEDHEEKRVRRVLMRKEEARKFAKATEVSGGGRARGRGRDSEICRGDESEEEDRPSRSSLRSCTFACAALPQIFFSSFFFFFFFFFCGMFVLCRRLPPRRAFTISATNSSSSRSSEFFAFLP